MRGIDVFSFLFILFLFDFLLLSLNVALSVSSRPPFVFLNVMLAVRFILCIHLVIARIYVVALSGIQFFLSVLFYRIELVTIIMFRDGFEHIGS